MARTALMLSIAVLLLTSCQTDISTINNNQTSPANTPIFSRIGLVQAHKNWSRRSAIFLDLRSNSAYGRTHIPGAVSIPADEIENRYDELPEDQLIITYADQSLETSSDEAVQFLISQGYTNIATMSGGIDGWIQSGYPIEP